MNTIFGFSRNAVALVGIIVAIILVVLVGMIVLGSAAIRALMAPGLKVEGVPLLALLVTIIVLLTGVFIMLLVLFFCCCKKDRTGREGQLPPDLIAALLPFLPLLPDLRNVLRDVGVALYAAGISLDWATRRMEDTASRVQNVMNDVRDATRIKVKVKTWPFNGAFGNDEVELNPLGGAAANLENNLRTIKDGLTNDFSYALTVENNVDLLTLSDIGTKLVDAGKALAKIADILHVNPRPPSELLQ